MCQNLYAVSSIGMYISFHMVCNSHFCAFRILFGMQNQSGEKKSVHLFATTFASSHSVDFIRLLWFFYFSSLRYEFLYLNGSSVNCLFNAIGIHHKIKVYHRLRSFMFFFLSFTWIDVRLMFIMMSICLLPLLWRNCFFFVFFLWKNRFHLTDSFSSRFI